MQSFEPQSQRQHSHTTYINIICFFIFFITGGLGSICPMFGYWQNLAWEIGGASFITACVLSSVQLADKKWIIPAAGFVVMSIAFIGFFTLIPCDSTEKIHEVAKNVILILPAMMMVSSFKLFPLWVRMFGFAACIPYILILILAKNGMNENKFNELMSIGYFLMQVTALCWGIYFLRLLRAERKK